MRALYGAFFAFAFATPALAQDWHEEISSYDRDRLADFAKAKEQGMAEASDRGFVESVVATEGRGISESELLGSWRCRTVKLGGMAPTMAYGWFRCRVRNTPNGLYFEKVTGSQRLYGYLDRFDNGGFLLLGSWAVGGERPKPYSGGNDGAGAPSTHTDAVGVVSAIGAGHVKIEFPYPFYESTFDVMELKR